MEELLFGEDEMSMREELLKDLLQNRVIVLNDVVDSDILENIILYILKFNKEDKDIPVEKRKPILLYLSSPGGNVITGFSLVDAIEASITPVYTVCFSNCSSMAFHIFISGHKRYAFKDSVLLSHDGEVSLNNSGAKAKDTMKFFDSVDDRIKEHVISRTNIDADFYDSIYEKEYYMYANDEAKRLGCVDYIIGEDVTLDSILS